MVGQTPEQPVLTVGDNDTNGNALAGKPVITYTSDNPSVIDVNKETGAIGEATAEGTAVITATSAPYDKYASAVAQYIVTVTPRPGTLSKYDENRPVGWGQNVTGSGTKGIGDTSAPVSPVVVTTRAQLLAAMQGDEPRTVYVKGTIHFEGADTIMNVSNKTLLGLSGSMLVNEKDYDSQETELENNINLTGILCFRNCRNIIIRNMHFKSPGAFDINGKDNLTFDESTDMWVDHCTFQDGTDGNFDAIHGSDNMSITWCHFYYDEPSRAGFESKDHRDCNLWGHDDSNYKEDEGRLNTTFANCFWDRGCRVRMPRVRFGKIHVYNCYYCSSDADNYIQYGYKSAFNVENCNFDKNKTALKESAGGGQYSYIVDGCVGSMTSGKKQAGDVAYYTPEYEYLKYPASEVAGVLSNSFNGAGATLYITEPENAEKPEMRVTTVKKYTTYSAAYDIDMSRVSPAGLKAYVAVSNTANSVTLEEVDYVPAATGVVLEGVPGQQYTLAEGSLTDASLEKENLLVPTFSYVFIGQNVSITYADIDQVFKLKLGDAADKPWLEDNDVSDGKRNIDGAVPDLGDEYILSDGMFRYSAPGHIAPFKAYLMLPLGTHLGSGGAMKIAFGGTATGIDDLGGTDNAHGDVYYNLHGMRVDAPHKGIYIKNGRKVIIK